LSRSKLDDSIITRSGVPPTGCEACECIPGIRVALVNDYSIVLERLLPLQPDIIVSDRQSEARDALD
jgi:hypothetical protein